MMCNLCLGHTICLALGVGGCLCGSMLQLGLDWVALGAANVVCISATYVVWHFP